MKPVPTRAGPPRPSAAPARRASRRAFTLIETMIVIAIMAIFLTISVPSLLRVVRKSPMRQATSDLLEGCHQARLMAILQGVPAELVINAQDGSLVVRPVPAEPGEPGSATLGTPTAEAAIGDQAAPTPVGGFSARLPDSIAFKRLSVNLRDMMEYDEARVHFYPNGTCDEFTATLLSEENEERNITLEITTARESVEIVR